jgi:hypothetical protein
MAQKFPHCDVIGLDWAPVSLESDNTPSNCRFEVGNIDCGLSHHHGGFDLIRVRCVGSGVSKFASLDVYTPFLMFKPNVNVSPFRLRTIAS